MICFDTTLLVIIIAPIVIGAIYYLKENKRDKLQDWKPHEWKRKTTNGKFGRTNKYPI